PEMISCNNTETLEFIGLQGFVIVDSNYNKVSTKFDASELYNFSIAKVNASNGSFLILRGCNFQGECADSTAKSPVEGTFSPSGVNLALVIPLAILGLAIVCIPGGIWYVKVELPRSRKRVADYPNLHQSKTDQPKEEAEEESDYHQMQSSKA